MHYLLSRVLVSKIWITSLFSIVSNSFFKHCSIIIINYSEKNSLLKIKWHSLQHNIKCIIKVHLDNIIENNLRFYLRRGLVTRYRTLTLIWILRHHTNIFFLEKLYFIWMNNYILTSIHKTTTWMIKSREAGGDIWITVLVIYINQLLFYASLLQILNDGNNENTKISKTADLKKS